MVQHVHHVRTPNAPGIIKPGVGKAARFEILDALAGPVRHIGLRTEHDRARGTRLDAGRLQADLDPVGAQRAFIRLVIDLADARDVKRAAFDAIAAADAVLADEIDNAVGVLYNRAWCWTCL